MKLLYYITTDLVWFGLVAINLNFQSLFSKLMHRYYENG